MQEAKQWLKDNGILPKISFEIDKPLTLKILKSKIEEFTNPKTNKKENGLKVLVTEDGEAKQFLTTSIALITRLAETTAGSVVKITQKQIGMKKTYESELIEANVEKVEEKEDELDFGEPVEMSDEEIPIVNDKLDDDPGFQKFNKDIS